jgi:undecaprenyl phosphate-alpha-L-ara4N flippase subunit ArnF
MVAVVAVTPFGDYLIKLATEKPAGLLSIHFIAGAALYGVPAIGWYYLMKNHSLALIGTFYSALTVILLALLGYVFFKESFGAREIVGISLAIYAVVVMNHR